MYDFLLSTLSSLNLQTELLEACDWDEALADDILAALSLAVKMSSTPEEIGRNIDFLLKGKANAKQIVIAKKIFNHEAQDIHKALKESGGIN